jgi:hypothetical protein
MANLRLKKIVLEVVENQLRDNNPPITRITLNRLKGLGYSDERSKEMIGAIVVEEIFDVLKKQESFDLNRFTERLSDLQ